MDPLADLDDWIKRAGKKWFENFGRARVTKRPREHKGLPMPKRTRDDTEAAFIRVRNAITSSLSGPVGDILPKQESTVTLGDLSDKQLEEMLFNQKKIDKAK
eukprot:1478912-Pyramimonas_sp.AAC.1